MMSHNVVDSHYCFSVFNKIQIDEKSCLVWGTRAPLNKSAIDNQHSSQLLPSCSSPVSTPEHHVLNETTPTETVGWSENAIRLLIVTYNEHKEKFKSPRYNKKEVWNLISHALREHKIYKSGLKCDEKWRNLKKTYEKVRTANKGTGGAPTHWFFFDEMHEIYFHDPHFNPVLTVSSSSGVKRSSGNEAENQETVKDGIQEKFSPSGKKRLSKSISSYEIDQNKQKRHKERMEQRERMFQWFQENVRKCD
jgi:hypothetical protein